MTGHSLGGTVEQEGWKRPRIGVISDVSPEDSVSGQKLLYRLLSSWDASAVHVVEGPVWPSDVSKRLRGVHYEVATYAPIRLLHTRLTDVVNAICLHTIRLWTMGIARAMKEFQAEAILTVAHGHLFLAASHVARRLELPLHVLLHDDWPTIMPGGRWPGSALHARFKRAYAQAASRLCVSPYMEEEYRKRYGIPGSVLLPGRAPDTPSSRVRPRGPRGRGFILAYAGSLPTQDYVLRLRSAAEVLRSLNGRLDLYTNASEHTLARVGLSGPHVKNHGFLPVPELHRVIAENADGLFLPMSFAANDRQTMSVCFPSKLVEYTAIGLPVIVWGPAYSAGARWITEHGGGALVATDPAPEAFKAVIELLSADAQLSGRVADSIVAAGNAQFSFSAIARQFQDAVGNGCSAA